MSSHRRCYSFGATSPLFAAHPPPFWPSFCVCFLANPCSSCLALCSVLYAACSSLCSASVPRPFSHRSPLSASIQPSPSRFKAPPFPYPTYVVAPVLQSRSGRQDLKKLFEAWYEKRQMKKIYSPLLEGLLSLYLGFEWIQTNNILAPIITHGIYSTVILGHGLWKIHDHRRRLRQRIQQLKSEERYSK
ncbi:uncharacterized protein LOC107614642 [Arachis ipaensis]|uniref:uncharacterized protein LOC107614642 n=1 Tax=Arachis ipaensis TaxID=130454 RepID=UPI000A2B7DCE|nr:uncharacterized protein LOC107614642 [Arachis ipaensis]XP_020968314.1 uncharacterized protein LOC107614642 [Arachis ipaensis]